MEATQSREQLKKELEQAVQDYLARLSPEHFMEAEAQGTQRKITLESLDLVHHYRPEVQVFNEMCVQYPRKGRRRIGQVVPDNMVVVWPEPINPGGSYDVQLQPTRPFWVLEYVSKYTKRKDYEDNFERYENELRVAYFLLFYPDTQDLTLYRHTGEKYASVPPDEQGRHPVPELELEVALLNGWARYWFRGRLLPLPADLQAQCDQQQVQLKANEERLRAQEEQLRAREEQIHQLLPLLRSQVEIRARAVGRQDILEQLPTVEDPVRLTQWLVELN